jgi:excisionase family DNA binding protein
MSIHSTGLGDNDKLVVSPKVAGRMLDVGETTIYALIGSGQLESYKDGKSRKILVRSIHARIERLLGEQS